MAGCVLLAGCMSVHFVNNFVAVDTVVVGTAAVVEPVLTLPFLE